MNLIEALKTGKPLRRPIAKHLGSGGDGWLGSEYVLSYIDPGSQVMNYFKNPHYVNIITRDDILAEDWETKND